MRTRLSLRGRFLAAMLLTVGACAGVFVYALHDVVELLESELLNHTLAQELAEFAADYAADPRAPPPHNEELTGYVVPAGHPEALPAPLRKLESGARHHLRLNGHRYYVGRAEVNGTQLVLLLDVTRVEAMERRLDLLAAVFVLGAFALAAGTALLLVRLVLRPVTGLAAAVARLQPGARHPPLADQFAGEEVGAIASAFDRFLAQIDAFVAREQAFTEDASHELRTPLAVVISGAQLMLEDAALPAQSRERLQRIERAARHMQSVIEALLFLAREDGGAPATEIALDEVVRDSVEVHRDAVAGRPVTLAVATQPFTVRAPPGMVACVVDNLLLNAVQFTERGRIDLAVEPGRLTVADSGAGIAPEDLSRIFERRYRGAGSRGLGLGLYLVKRICDRLGWTIAIDSRPGAGTRFELRMPAA